MKPKFRLITIIFCLMIFISFSIPVYAQSGPPATLSSLSDIVQRIVNAMYIISELVFFIMIVVNGFNYLISAGNPEKIKKARSGLTFTIVGFLLIFASYFIIVLIANITGLNSNPDATYLNNGQINFKFSF